MVETDVMQTLILEFPRATPDEAFSQFASIVIPIDSTTQPTVTVCSHAADNVVLLTGLVARPSFIISGDKHLLILKKFRNIDIVTPSAFLKLHGS
jgi:predicted nucleic acid-binding protein